ncbi:VOC family protein [Micromonospora craniellae]|uniref:VOC family protein n=1 Tax=Micromonospora craniellae TaxID=2294034 RepID=A0A372G4C1_9ACTN|nr:VOC family protein [Micromonospora craniellae]QOC92836.1 VOC family protein [Micromonospora craniellae]RFS47616.1 VOC family protein [Micromonospora craniellae]
MKLGHVIYKVNDLDRAVEEYTAKGFTVEYGKAKNSSNALIYFAEGPYFELLGSTGMPGFAKQVFRLFGKGAFIDRLDAWDRAEEGLIGLALENDRLDIEQEQKILDEAKLTYLKGRSGRTDPKGRRIRFRGIFPDDMQLPVLSSTFNVDVRPPEGYVHPNGIKGIKGVAFGTRQELIPVIRRLCDDEGLTLFEGKGVKDVEFEYAAKPADPET